MQQDQMRLGGALRLVCGSVAGLVAIAQSMPTGYALGAAFLSGGLLAAPEVSASDEASDSAAASEDEEDCGKNGCSKKATVDSGEGDVCREDDDCDDCNTSNPDDSDNDDQIAGDNCPCPVTSDTGEKWETVHDLVVKVKGADFKLTRQYTSDLRLSTDPYDSPYIPEYYDPSLEYAASDPDIVGAITQKVTPLVARPSVAPNVGNGWGFSNLRSVSLAQSMGCVRRDCDSNPGPPYGGTAEYTGSAAWINRPNRKPRQLNLPTDLGVNDDYYISDPEGGPGNQSVIVYEGFTRTKLTQQGVPCVAGCGSGGSSFNWQYEGRIRFQEPGQWKQEFVIQDNVGFIVLDEDEYGNRREYIDENSDGIPDVIYLNGISKNWGDGDRAEAWVQLYWDTTAATAPKLARAEVYRPRPSGGPVVTQYVKYYYLNGAGTSVMHWDKDFDPSTTDDGFEVLAGVTPSGDLGTGGDLVQVETYTAVNLNDLVDYTTPSAMSEPAQWRAQVTQYRYHDGGAVPSTGDIRLRTGGFAHQLKMELMPQQIEFAVQQRLADGGTPDDMSVVNESYELLKKDDDATAFTDSSMTDIKMYQVAAKIISYDTTVALSPLRTVQSPVDRQFIQSSAGCGCGSVGTTNALMREYEQMDGWAATPMGASAPIDGQSLHITEYEVTSFSDYPAGDGYRTYTTDLLMLGPNEDKPYVWMMATIDNAAGGRTWAHEYTYDWDKRSRTGYYTSSAITGYTAAQSTPTAPTVTHASSGEGLIVQYGFETDSGTDSNENVSTVSRGAVGGAQMVRKTLHRNDMSFRHHLASEVTAYREGGSTGDPVEEVMTYEYGFREVAMGGGGTGYTAQVGWEKVITERELATENGPSGTGNTVVHWSFYDEEGQLRWEIDPDETLTKYEYDDLTGALIRITRNANPPSGGELAELLVPGSSPFPGSAGSGGQLVTEYTRDEMGRVLAVERPGEVFSYTAREMREDPATERDGILYYSVLTLPHYLAGTSSPKEFDGPAVVQYMDAAGTTTRVESYEMDTSASYAPTSSVYTLSTTKLTQTEIVQDLSGTVTQTKSWWDISGDQYYTTTYEHDGFGRLSRVVDGNETVTETEYDVLNRPLTISMGAYSITNPSNPGLVPIVDYIYDGDPAESFTDPGDSAEIEDAQGVGNGTITTIIQHDGESERITRLYYDDRDRQIAVLEPDSPLVMYRYDNLDRVIQMALYAEPASVPSAASVETAAGTAAADLGTSFSGVTRSRYTRTYYSQRGYRWKVEHDINPSNNADYYLQTNYWYDDDGNTVARWDPSSPMVITEYDVHDRPIKVFVSDRGGDVEDGSNGYYTYASATGITGDNILEQAEYEYDDGSGAVTRVTHRVRLHDTTATGDLSASSGDNAITTYMGYTYDDAWRRQASINFGTNKAGSDAFSATAAAAPTLTSYDELNELRQAGDLPYRWVTYNTRGLVEDVIGIQEDGTGSTPASADIVTRYLYDDRNRTIAQIENADAVSSVTWSTDRYAVSGFDHTKPDTDRVTSFVYDAINNVTKRVAHIAEDNGGGGTQEGLQITRYVYGALAGSSANTMDSLINSNSMLIEVRYPDESTGLPGTTDSYKVKYAYNRLGEVRGATDQNQTVHAYGRDDYGRVLTDTVTIPGGSDVDTHIERIGYAFDANGRLETVTSYEDTSGTTVADQVKFGYTPLWQIETVEQQHDGAVVGGSSPRVLYKYADWDIDFANGENMNYSRMWTQVYPTDADGENTVYYRYGETFNSGNNIDNRISRPVEVRAKGWVGTAFQGTIAEYEWIGMGRVAREVLPNVANSAGGIVLDRTRRHDGTDPREDSPTALDAYPAFDRYGRVVEHRWVRADFDEHSTLSSIANQPAAVEIHHTYDRMSNRLEAHDAREGLRLPATQRELNYDRLNRLIRETRTDPSGVDSSYADGHVGQEWTLDMLGNWDKVLLDDDGTAGFNNSTDSYDSRTFNSANEIDNAAQQYDRVMQKSGVVPSYTPTYYSYSYDDNGNMTDERRGPAVPTPGDTLSGLVHVYDAWNRLVKTEYDGAGANKDVAVYTYNGLGWRTSKEMDLSTGAYDGTMDQKRYFLYNASWQIVEEHVDTDNDGDVDWKEQQFWGVRYIDDAIAKRVDRDTDDSWSWVDSDTTRWYQLSDSQFSVAAILEEDGDVYERLYYDAYGNAEHRYPGDYDDNKSISFPEVSSLTNGGAARGIGTTGYDADIDVNLDGTVNDADVAQIAGAHGYTGSLGEGWISSPDSTGGPDNSIGYAGYVFNSEREDYTVRYRVYHAKLGRWMTRDPVGYIDGGSMYAYVDSNSLRYIDPFGLKYVDTGEGTSSYVPGSGSMHYEVSNPQGGIGNSNSGYRHKGTVDWDCVGCDPDVIAAKKALDAAEGNPTPSNPFDDGDVAFSIGANMYQGAILETSAAGFAKVTGDQFTKKFGGAMTGGVMTGAEMLAVGKDGDAYDVLQTGISGGAATAVGFFAGAKAGAALGTFGGPAGIVGGFVVGGLTAWATDSIIDSVSKNSKRVRDAREDYSNAIKNAIEKCRD